MNIYVGNLDYKVKEDQLEEIFEEFGQVSSVKIISDKFTGRSKGFAFVTMEDDEDAGKAINELNGYKLFSRDIVVNEAKPRKETSYRQ